MTSLVVISVIIFWILLSAGIGISVCMFSSQLSQAEESPVRYRRFKQALAAEPSEESGVSTAPANPNVSPSHQLGKA